MFCVSIMVVVRNTSKISKTTDSYRSTVVRLMAVITTNLLPSITLTLLSVLALSYVNFPSSLEANVAFIIFHINACLNPVINTITTNAFLKALNDHVTLPLKPHIVKWSTKLKTGAT